MTPVPYSKVYQDATFDPACVRITPRLMKFLLLWLVVVDVLLLLWCDENNQTNNQIPAVRQKKAKNRVWPDVRKKRSDEVPMKVNIQIYTNMHLV